jgi:hypothetical protein
VTFAPPPVLLHPARCEEHVGADLAPVHHSSPKLYRSIRIPRSVVPRQYADKGRKSSGWRGRHLLKGRWLSRTGRRSLAPG